MYMYIINANACILTRTLYTGALCLIEMQETLLDVLYQL